MDEPPDQLRRFDARHQPADILRRYREYHFAGQPETFAERHTGSEAPRHDSHAGLEHRWRFNDYGADRRSADVAKSLHELGHASEVASSFTGNVRLP